MKKRIMDEDIISNLKVKFDCAVVQSIFGLVKKKHNDYKQIDRWHGVRRDGQD